MKGVCNGHRSQLVELRAVAKAFVDLQQSRHLADYDNSKVWTRVAVMSNITTATKAFQMWERVKSRPEAQDFLLSLFAADRR